MPVTIKSAPLKYKNSSGEFVGINAIAEASTAQQIASINQAGAAQIAAINADIAHSPIIGDNGNWYTWDVEEQDYVDSGEPSRGIQGPQGPQGAQGDAAPAASVATAVDAYLAENFSNPSNPPLDRTLLSSSSAAPADMVGDLKNAIKLIQPTKKGAFITFANETVNVNSFVNNASYDCYVVPCSAGDKFTVSCLGGGNAKAYGFVDSSGNKLSVSPNDYTAKGIVLTAPTSSAYLVINDKGGYTSYYGDINLYLQGKGVLSSSDASNGITLDMLSNGVWQVGAAFFSGDSTGTTNTKTPTDFVTALTGYYLISVRFSQNACVQIAIAHEYNKAFIRRIISNAWTKWTSFSGMGSNYVGDISDFNDLILPGYYTINTAKMQTISNAPSLKEIADCLVMNYNLNETGFKQQVLFYAESGTILFRQYNTSTSTWTEWTSAGISYNNSISTETSLDNVVKTGFYYITTSMIAQMGAPCKYASPLLVFSPGNASGTVSQIVFDTRDGKIYSRKLLNGEWTEWIVIESKENGMTWAYDFDDTQLDIPDTWEEEWEEQLDPENPGRPNLITSNTGIDLKLATYNVACYNYKTIGGHAAYLYSLPEKLLNLRKYISNGDFDILTTQEDAAYIDSQSSCSASKFIYYDRLPTKAGSIMARVRCKRPVTVSQSVLVSTVMDQYYTKTEPTTLHTANTRGFTWAIMPVNGKNVLLISCHPRNSYGYLYNSEPTNGPVKDRKNFLQVIFDLIYCLKHPEVYEGIAENINAPWDYVIIGGDFNTSNVNGQSTASGYPAYIDNTNKPDFANLCEIRDHYSFDSANGGYLNWFVTHKQNGGSSLDNILVSGNVMLKSIDANYGYFASLYSDHIPVEATVTLLSETDNPGVDLLRFPAKTFEGKDYTDSTDLSALRTWFTQIMTGEIQYPCV